MIAATWGRMPCVSATPEVTGRRRSRVARNTIIFSIATGLSRIMGVVREIVAARYYGTTGPASAFTLAFQIPNLVRSLFADAAISAAFVPVFTELLEKGNRREAFELAGSLLMIVLAGLGAISLIFIVFAGQIMPLFIGDEFTPYLTHLTVVMSQLLFPIVVLLGVNGLIVGILNAYEHFTIPALAPLVWNLMIIVSLIALRPLFSVGHEIYAYAVGVLAGTIVQLAMSIPPLRHLDFKFSFRGSLRDPRIGQVLKLMLPVTIGLGVINFDLVINSSLGSLVSVDAPRAIDAAFRVYMLPQGMFSVALATVLFPTLSRYAARNDLDGLRATMSTGVRAIFLLLIPAATFTFVMATPIVRLIYQHGVFGPRSTDRVSTALFWFSFSLPFAGVNLLLTRTFFSLQRPWIPTALATANLVVNALISLALYKPLGIAGLVIGTAVASAGMTFSQAFYLRRELHGRLEGGRTLMAIARMSLAAAALGGVSYVTWWALDSALGRSIPAQLLSVSAAAVAGFVVYAALVLMMRIPEAQRIELAVAGRLRRRR
jgi:putative peptidoglycan lipid II flippase